MFRGFRLFGHPSHPMMNHVPIGTWLVSVPFDVLGLWSGSPLWWAVSFWSIVAGPVAAAHDGAQRNGRLRDQRATLSPGMPSHHSHDLDAHRRGRVCVEPGLSARPGASGFHVTPAGYRLRLPRVAASDGWRLARREIGLRSWRRCAQISHLIVIGTRG